MSSPISALILAAGSGSRMGNKMSMPKPMSPINNEPLLHRNLRQLHEQGIHDFNIVTGFCADRIESCGKSIFSHIRFVHNPIYAQDRNIYSTLLGLGAIPEGHGVILLEGDVIFSDKAINRFFSKIEAENNAWTACGNFVPGQRGGILRDNGNGWLGEIRYSEWFPKLKDWYKNLGAVYIAPDYVPLFHDLLFQYASASMDQYFLTPWAENLDKLPAKIINLGTEAGSFNTISEYECLKTKFHSKLSLPSLSLVEVSRLKHIEDFDPKRVRWLAEKIEYEGQWTAPLAISNEYLVMDGQHRMEAAKKLGLAKIPALFFDYADVQVYSLRPEINLDAPSVVANALTNNIYPYKTVKHLLPPIPTCAITLDSLRVA